MLSKTAEYLTLVTLPPTDRWDRLTEKLHITSGPIKYSAVSVSKVFSSLSKKNTREKREKESKQKLIKMN